MEENNGLSYDTLVRGFYRQPPTSVSVTYYGLGI